MTGDDMFELAERLDRIAVAVERIAKAMELVPMSTAALAAERARCPAVHPLGRQRCLLTAEHGFRHMDANERRW